MKTYLQILTYGRGLYLYAVLAFVALGCYNVFGTASLTLVVPFLEILFSAEAPAPPPAAVESFSLSGIKAQAYVYLYNQMETYGRVSVLFGFCLVVGGAMVLKNLSKYLSAYFLAPFELGVIRNLRNRIFEHLARLSLTFYARKPRGHLTTLVVSDVEIVQSAVIGTLMPVLSDPLTMLFLLGAMVLLSWKLTLLTLVILPLTGLAISRISKSLRRNARYGQAQFDGLLALLDEFLGGIRIVKAFAAEAFQVARYREQNEAYTRRMTRLRRRDGLASPVTEMLGISVALVIMYLGGRMILAESGDLKASEFIGFIVLFSQFIAPIRTFSSALSRIQKAIVSYQRIEALLNEPVQPTERTLPGPSPVFREQIEFRQVSFAYGTTRVLDNINLTLNKGETVALVGASGSGKSTLIDLLCRFYDPTEGGIYVDGQDLRTLDARSWRRLLGIVTQEPILFNDTVAGNIAYGLEHCDRTRLVSAAEVAHAAGFIADLELGYDTPLGERGGCLSGGQRQRIAIARAVLREPELLIFDEATSALDSASERVVQAAIDELARERTCILVAHRLSTVRNADRIIVLEQGRIAEIGTHDELLARKGLYTRLHSLQYQ